MLDLSNWKPSTNVLKGACTTTAELFKSSKPTYEMSVDLTQVRAQIDSNKGVTMIYRPFDFGRRSWHLKLDVDEDKNVSIWIVERGPLI